jgi:hypothetical protein
LFKAIDYLQQSIDRTELELQQLEIPPSITKTEVVALLEPIADKLTDKDFGLAAIQERVSTAVDELSSPTYGLEKIKEVVGSSSDAVTVSTLHGRMKELSDLVGHPRLVEAANPPTVPNAVITPETGLYFAMSEMFRWHMANMQTEELLARLPDPSRLRWAKRMIAAFLIASLRTQNATGTDTGRNAPWLVGRTSGTTEDPGILVSTIRYEELNTQNGKVSGWLIVKNGVNITMLMKSATDVIPTLMYGQQAMDYLMHTIERFETEATIPNAYDFSVFESSEVPTSTDGYASPLLGTVGTYYTDDLKIESRMHCRCFYNHQDSQEPAVSYCSVHLIGNVAITIDTANVPINIDQRHCYSRPE